LNLPMLTPTDTTDNTVDWETARIILESELDAFDPTMSPERKQRILEKIERETSWGDKIYLDDYIGMRYERNIKIWLMTRHEVSADEVMEKLNEFISERSGTPLVVGDVTALL